MKTILHLSLLILVVHAVPNSLTINNQLNDEWETYKLNFGRKYDSMTDIFRRIIWERNLKYIQQHNLEYDLGKHSYNLGLNQFADMTNEEFKTQFLRKRLINKKFNGTNFINPENLFNLPLSVDWRIKGYVTPVKNQGLCGSCWAFSTTGSLEGQHFRKTKNLVSFSEKQLVDCSGEFGNKGCNGGWMDSAFQYIMEYGIESEQYYPYTAADENCQYNKSKVCGTCTGFVEISSGNEKHLAVAVATVGPISVAIDASHGGFQFYKSGIYNDPECSSKKEELDHAVLIVGYGSENGVNYWIVKNSWDIYWGLAGYIKMTKDVNNQCGIATVASYPLV